MRSCSSGSCGAIQGAASASDAEQENEAAADDDLGIAQRSADSRRQRSARRCVAARRCARAPRQPCRSLGLSSDDEQIDAHVDQDEQRAEHQRQALDQRQVAIDDRVDRHIADAGIGEDALDDHRAADQEGELHAGQRQRRRRRRCASASCSTSRSSRHALEPREQHIVLHHRLAQRLLEHARDDGGERQASASVGMIMCRRMSQNTREAQRERGSRAR